MNYSNVRGACVFFLVCVVFFPLGNAMAELRLDSSFLLAESYTSNLFFEDQNEQDDFATFVGPNFTLTFENPDVVIGATYMGQMSFFINNPGSNRYNQNANIRLDLPFLTKRYKGLTVTIDESMNFTPQLDAFSLSGAEDASATTTVSQRDVIAGRGGTGGTGVFTTRSSAFNNNAGITFGYAWTPRVQSSLGYSNQYLHFFSKGFQDSLTHIGFTRLSYQATRRTSLNSSYSYAQTEFIGKSTQLTTSADRIISHNPQVGASHTLTPTVTVTVSGGISFIKQVGATEQIQGPGQPIMTRMLSEKFIARFTGSANVSKIYTHGTMGATFAQTVGNGAGLAAQATNTQSVTGFIAHALTQRMSGNASVGWAKNDSIEGNAFDSTTYRIQVGLGYDFTSWLNGNFSYSHIKQTSSGSAATDLNVDQFFLLLTATADPWYIYR